MQNQQAWSPQKETNGGAEPALYRDEIQDVICWEQLFKSTQNKRYEFTQISHELLVGKSGTKTPPIQNQNWLKPKSCISSTVAGVMRFCCLFMDNFCKGLIIDLHPNLDYTKGSKKNEFGITPQPPNGQRAWQAQRSVLQRWRMLLEIKSVLYVHSVCRLDPVNKGI